MMLPLICLICNILIVSSATTSNNGSALVHTSCGTLEGVVHALGNGKSMDVFLGIPYAEPPIGELRFEKPLAPHKWEGIRLAQHNPPICIPHARPDISGEDGFSEDCLYLNVFAPHQEQTESTNDNNKGSTIPRDQLHPVLFIVHGGGFEAGSARAYGHSEMGERFVDKGIVVVTVQYRLGFLGFASTGDKVMPGNLGLWDLVAALRWFRTEANAWRADHRRITLFGYSAGAAAVSALGMSPWGRTLFQQAVQMSGSMLCSTKTGTFVPNSTRELAKAVGCPVDDSVELKECLRTKSVGELHDGVNKIGPTQSDVNFAKFASRADDGHFFPRDMIELIHESPAKPTMLGHNRLDSLAYTLIKKHNDSMGQYVIPPNRRQLFGQSDFDSFVRQVVAKEEHFGPKAAQVQAEIIDFFTRKYKVPAQKDNRFFLERHAMVLSDLQYMMPAVWESRLKANWGWPLFLYEFAWTEAAVFPTDVPVQEAFHMLDHDLLFVHYKGSEKARAVGDFLAEAVANFVRTGFPGTQAVLWLSANREEPMRHLLVDGTRPKMRQTMDLERLKFWHQLTENNPEYNLIRGTPGGQRTGHDEF